MLSCKTKNTTVTSRQLCFCYCLALGRKCLFKKKNLLLLLRRLRRPNTQPHKQTRTTHTLQRTTRLHRSHTHTHTHALIHAHENEKRIGLARAFTHTTWKCLEMLTPPPPANNPDLTRTEPITIGTHKFLCASCLCSVAPFSFTHTKRTGLQICTGRT